MTFRDKRTGEEIKANTYALVFAFSHNSHYELIEETKEEKPKANSKDKTKTKEEKPKDNEIVK